MIRLRPRLVAMLAVLVVTATSLVALGPAAAQSQEQCFGRTPTITGTDGDDFVAGTNRSDVISTGNGRDLVDGANGNDLICTGLGNDAARGGNGRDRMDGGWGRDAMDGQSGNDQLVGGPVLLARHECRGGTWHVVTYDISVQPAREIDDRDTGQPCNQPPPPPIDRTTELDGDVLGGGSGADNLTGGGGNDALGGGSGNDRASGDLGDDLIIGQGGNDRLNAGPVLMTRWECIDAQWHLVTYDVSVTPAQRVDDINTGQPCEQPPSPPIDPTDNDRASGGNGRDRLGGGFGDDTLGGGNGPDRLDGDAGTDALNGGRGPDSCSEGEENRSC